MVLGSSPNVPNITNIKNIKFHSTELIWRFLYVFIATIINSIILWSKKYTILSYLINYNFKRNYPIYFSNPIEMFELYWNITFKLSILLLLLLLIINIILFSLPGLYKFEWNLLKEYLFTFIFYFFLITFFLIEIYIPFELDFLLSYQTEAIHYQMNISFFYQYIFSTIFQFTKLISLIFILKVSNIFYFNNHIITNRIIWYPIIFIIFDFSLIIILIFEISRLYTNLN